MQDDLHEAQGTEQRQHGDLTVARVAKELHIRRESVVAFLKSGQLEGYDVSLPGALRPSYRIPRASLTKFKSARSAKKAEPAKQRKRSQPQDVREFF